MMERLEKEFNKCWNEMLNKCYTCKCKDDVGFAIKLKHLHIFGKQFKKDLFKTIKPLSNKPNKEE